MVLSIMDSSFEGGIFAGKKLLVGGMWWANLIHARTLSMYKLIKQSKHTIKMEVLLSFFPL